MPKGNRPVYLLKLFSKDNTKQRTTAGVAFPGKFNQMNIKLNPGIEISWKDELFIVLEPYDPDEPPIRFKDQEEPKPGDLPKEGKKGDDDIPF